MRQQLETTGIGGPELCFLQQCIPAAVELSKSGGHAAIRGSLGFNWYYAIFPQLEQNAIFNSVNFSISPMNSSQYSAAVTKVNSLLCPSESANLQLYSSSYTGVTGGNYIGR